MRDSKFAGSLAMNVLLNILVMLFVHNARPDTLIHHFKNLQFIVVGESVTGSKSNPSSIKMPIGQLAQ